MLQLTTERLQFRQWTEEDYPPVQAFFTKKENAQFVGGVQNPESSWRLIATYVGHFQLKGYSYLAIETKSDEQLIGTVGLWKSEPWPEHEMGYWLLPRMQGKGYGLEAGKAVLNHGKAIGLPSLVSYIDPRNEPSKKLALGLGAHLDSTIQLLEFGPHEVYRYW